MPKIVIDEIDQTSLNFQTDNDEVVYIPGFVDVDEAHNANLYDDDGAYIGLEVNKPTLFTTVAAFEKLCGKQGAQFTTDQKYLDLNTAPGIGFDLSSIPTDGILFKKGTTDPSYVMAKELLARGLSVLYERINSGDEIDNGTLGSNIDLGSGITTFPIDTDYLCYGPTYTSLSNYIEAPKYYKNLTTADSPINRDSLNKYNQIYQKRIDLDKNAVSYDEIAGVYSLETSSDKIKNGANGVTFYDRTGTEGDYQYSEITEGITINDDGTLTIAAGASIAGALCATYSYYPDSMPIVTNDTIEITDNDLYVQQIMYIVSKSIDSSDPDNPIIIYTPIVNGSNTSVTPATPTLYAEHSAAVADLYTEYKSYYQELEGLISAAGKTKVNNVLYYKKLGTNIQVVYNALKGLFTTEDNDYDGLKDKGNYSIKYLTSGGYPVYGYSYTDKGDSITKLMLQLARDRGDCTAFIDHTNNPERATADLYDTVREDSANFDLLGEYGTMFTPWASYNRLSYDFDTESNSRTSAPTEFAGTFGYLSALAETLKSGKTWNAIAGSARGVIESFLNKNIGVSQVIPNGLADHLSGSENDYDRAINAITLIRPYGNTIWGNRTLKDNTAGLKATSLLSVRNIVSDIKKVVYRTARKLTFEQNNDVLWVNFTADISKVLDQMQSLNAISGYKILKNTTRAEAQDKLALCADIIIYPVYPVEKFYISVILKDGEATIEG